jgi:acyl-CoA thioesterase
MFPDMGAFARATEVRSAGDGWEAAIADGWDIVGRANGGYLLAIAARALTAATGRPDPATVTAHYLAPGSPGPITVATEVHKSGKRFTTASARMRSAERPLLVALASLTDLSPTEPNIERIEATPPALPDVDDCIPIEAAPPFPPPFMNRVELRLHPDDAGFARGRPSGDPLVRGWFRLRDGEPIDTVALLCAVDAFPPTAFNAALPVAWTPTLELTAHIRARPAPGWLRCQFTTRFVSGGFLEEDGEVWDASGRLVAQSRQLALVPRA